MWLKTLSGRIRKRLFPHRAVLSPRARPYAFFATKRGKRGYDNLIRTLYCGKERPKFLKMVVWVLLKISAALTRAMSTFPLVLKSLTYRLVSSVLTEASMQSEIQLRKYQDIESLFDHPSLQGLAGERSVWNILANGVKQDRPHQAPP